MLSQGNVLITVLYEIVYTLGVILIIYLAAVTDRI